MEQVKKLIKRTPIPIAGLSLALAATGNIALSYGTIYKNIFGIISALLLLILVIKIIIDSQSVLEELKNPLIAGIFPTFTMCLMLLTDYIKPYLPMVSFTVWLLGLLLHCFLILHFTVNFLFNFDIRKVFPSYFVVYVGIICGSIIAPTYGLISISKTIFWFGFISYLCLLPIVIYNEPIG